MSTINEALCNYTQQSSINDHRLDHLVLSFRGQERQAPSHLRLARFLELNAEDRAAQEGSLGKATKEAMLEREINEFNQRPEIRVNHKYAINDNMGWCIKNLVLRVAPNVKDIMSEHLGTTKNDDAAWSSELLRRPRWLLGSTIGTGRWGDILTVGGDAQESFMRRVLRNHAIKNTGKGRTIRMSLEQWDQEVSHMCVATAALNSLQTTGAPNFDDQLARTWERVLDGCCDQSP